LPQSSTDTGIGLREAKSQCDKFSNTISKKTKSSKKESETTKALGQNQKDERIERTRGGRANDQGR
ncbi:hypothetical protein C922_05380, partial [Plasmodium inui San Antonio 1]